MKAINSSTVFGLKGFIKEMSDTLKASGKLNIKLPARKAIIDHCVTCPEMYGKAMAI